MAIGSRVKIGNAGVVKKMRGGGMVKKKPVKMRGGGMMKKPMKMKEGGSLDMVMVDGKKVPAFAADGKGAKDLKKMRGGGMMKKPMKMRGGGMMKKDKG